MLTISDLRFSLAGRLLFDAAEARVPEGWRVGLVGRNGAGKTTLFRLIRGELTPDQGAIVVPRSWRIGGVAQEAPATRDSLLDLVLAADVERASLLAEADEAVAPDRIAEIHARLADIDAHSAEARASAILSGLGFDAAAQARAAAEFSGGWRMRVALAGALFAAPDLLLLDEPTNYLDLEGSVWLESFLARYPRTVLLISHDRGLLNRAVGAILHLSERKLSLTPGPYDRFASLRRARMAEQTAHAARQSAERARIQGFVDRFRAKASKARQAQARLKMLEKMEPIAAAAEESVAPFDFPSPEPLNPPLVTIDQAAVGYGGAPVLKDIDLRLDPDDRIALLGANGQGKSTLSKLLAGRLAPSDGKVGSSGKLRIGYFAQHQLDELDPGADAVQHLARRRPDDPPAALRSRLASVGLGPEAAQTPSAQLSGGQRARLLLALAAIDAPHLLILDEPTNHLDIESRDALIQALAGYDGAVILVSHDPHLVESVADRLWLVQDGRVRPFDGDMAGYRKLLMSERGGDGGRQADGAGGGGRRAARRGAAEIRKKLEPLRAEIARCEARIEKLEAMRATVDERLADPTLYGGPAEALEELGRKRAEIENGLSRAEALWMAAEAAYEAAETEFAEAAAEENGADRA